MSQIGKILLFTGMVFMCLWLISMRIFQGGLMPFVWILLGLGVVCLAVAIFKDFRFFVDLAGQRTTKHGTNLGVLVLLVVVIMVGVNYLGYRHKKTFDFTKEGLHSLSDQSKSILHGLKHDLDVKAFFADNDAQANQAHQKFKEVADMYEVQSPHVKIAFINPVRKPDVAKQYEIKSDATVSLEYNGRKTMFEDLTEQGFTNAIIKVTRDKNKTIYFVTGHGERDIDGTGPTELNALKKYLDDSSYDTKKLNFVEKQMVPDDADVVVIAGPKTAYFDAEIQALKDYLYRGGHLLIALDPGTKTNLGKLTEDLGIEFENNYILDPYGQLVGGSAALVTGMDFSKSNDITKSFHQSITLFQLASALEPVKVRPEGLTIEEIVKSSPRAFTRADIVAGKLKLDPAKDKMEPRTVVAAVNGKLKEEAGKPAPQEFSAVIAGDSDYLSNQLIDVQLNHDLDLNTIAYLAKDKDLVSIRPKKSEGNIVTETEVQKSLVGWLLVVICPFFMFVTGGAFWYRRRAI